MPVLRGEPERQGGSRRPPGYGYEDLEDDDFEVVDDDGLPIRPEMDADEAAAAEDFTVSDLPDGGVLIDFDPTASRALSAFEPPRDEGHNANVAEHMDRHTLRRIADDVIEGFERDWDSAKEWRDKKRKGIKLMGVTDKGLGDGPFPGASRVVHPMLTEAMIQFQARAVAELWPSEGPVKGKIIGKVTEERTAQMERVVGFMNFQYTEEIEEAYDEMDRLLFLLPGDGSMFKKIVPDTTLGRITHEVIPGEDLVVNYGAKDLATAIRVTHRMRRPRNDTLKRMRDGEYLDAELGADSVDEDDEQLRMIEDAIEGRQKPTADDEDLVDEIIEQHVEYDVPGFEDVDETGEPTGIGLPWVITVHRDTREVLAIRRNWREDDGYLKKRPWFVHYKYLPGPGFYGLGLYHVIGGLSAAATGSLRALLDAAQFANMPAGFKSKDAKLQSTVLSPGQWADTELSAEELQKCFYMPPYKEPSAVLFNLLGFLQDAAQRIASTTEMMVGDADNKAPVGTTVALIEQGSKVFSSIHKRCHRAQGREFRLQAQLNFDLMEPGASYPYEIEGDEQYVMRDDFDGRVDVIPVSDPNIFSQTQRIAQGQALVALSKEAPTLYDLRAVHLRMLKALRIPEAEDLLPDPSDIARMTALEENMAFLHGKPAKVFEDQDHRAHMQIHQMWFATLPPDAQKMLQAPFMEHMGQHMAWDYRLKIMATLGVPLPPAPDFRATRSDEARQGGDIPPEVERQIDAAVAQAAQLVAQQEQAAMAAQAEQATAADPEAAAAMAEAKAEAQRKDLLAAAEAKRKDMLAARDADREDWTAQRSVQRETALAQVQVHEQDLRAAADIRREGALAPMRLAMKQREQAASAKPGSRPAAR